MLVNLYKGTTVMENFYLDLLQANGEVAGQEGLPLPKLFTPIEGFRIRLSSLSLQLDKKIAGMSRSIHEVKYQSAQMRAEKLKYLKCDSNTLPIPTNFDPRNITWEKYINYCISAVSLVDNFKTDSARFYDWLREIAAKGKVGGTFRYTISGTARQIDSLDGFIKLLGNKSHTATRPLADMYPSFNEMFKQINTYNNTVKMVKARDAEIIAKQLKLNADLGELVLARIVSSDIVLNESDIKTIQVTFDEFERYMNITGAMVGLLNELSAVLTAQCKEVEKW